VHARGKEGQIGEHTRSKELKEKHNQGKEAKDSTLKRDSRTRARARWRGVAAWRVFPRLRYSLLLHYSTLHFQSTVVRGVGSYKKLVVSYVRIFQITFKEEE
jgi:hypothetical protein